MVRQTLLLAAALPLGLAAIGPTFAAEPAGVVLVAQAEDRIAASRQALEKAQASLEQAEETGGDIRAARIAVANALKSLRAAELAAGVAPPPAAATAPAPPPKAAAPAVTPVEPPAQNPAPATTAEAAPTGPKPYVPPTVPEKPAAKPKAAAKTEAPPAKPTVAPKQKAPSVAEPRSSRPVVVRRGSEIETTTTHADGSSTIDIADSSGRLIRRIEVDRRGNEVVVIDQERVAGPRYVDPREVPPPPDYDGGDYVLNGDSASEADIESTLGAAPIERPMRGYSLNEIRRDGRIRDMVRRVDLDTITFESGSARVPDDQVRKLRAMGRALGRMLDRRPDQVFLIEGHTDAVGTRLANLELSDRRAASVAAILTQYFDIPPQNLVAQGYGEDQLKIPTEGPQRQNRRVTIRNITPLLGGG